MSLTPEENAVPVQITTGIGRASVKIAGRDVSKELAGFSVDMRAGDTLAEVTLVAHPRAGVDFDGLAHVTVKQVMQDPGPAAAVFLDAIDPKLLEEAALHRTDLGSGPHALTQAMLNQLKDWANGRS